MCGDINIAFGKKTVIGLNPLIHSELMVPNVFLCLALSFQNCLRPCGGNAQIGDKSHTKVRIAFGKNIIFGLYSKTLKEVRGKKMSQSGLA